LGSDYDGALVEYLKALAIQESVLEFVLGTEHQDAANTSNNIGEVLYTKGDYDRASVEYRNSLAIFESFLGMEQDAVNTYNNLHMVQKKKSNDNGALEGSV
jgi:tetratricopeptide (TPR) repeat protein